MSEEIKSKTDQVVEMFYNAQIEVLNKNGAAEIHEVEMEIATHGGIIMYEDRVKLLTEIRSITKQMLDQLAATYKFEIMDGEFDLLSESEAILTELKSRL